MEYTKQIKELADIPFGKEFQAYLIALASAATGKPKPPPEFVRNLERENSTFVTANDIRHVMSEMKAVFKENGYMPHKELENKLMQRLCPDLATVELERADEIIAGEYSPDPLTGFLQKPLVPLATAEAWLYAQSTGEPAHMLEIDFSNMRGTNEHYERILHSMSPDKDQNTVREQAMKLTDRAARHVSDEIINTIEKEATGQEQIRYTALRTGGDEARVILSGVSEEKLPALIDKIHDAIEQEVKTHGLQNHPHAKAPGDPVRNGFGAALASIKLNGMNNLAEAIRDADETIKETKNRIGKRRLKGQNTSHKASIRDKIKLDFENHNNAPASGISAIFGDNVPDKVLSLDQIREAAFVNLKTRMEEESGSITPAALRLLETKIARYPAIDYASNTLMPRDQPVIAAIFRDVLIKQQTMDTRDDPPVLHGLGISLHNLSGLNNVLGHEAANACLYHAANDIIRPVLHHYGIPDSHFTLAHYGGGEFRAIIKDPRGRSGYDISDGTMDKISKDIKERIEKLNDSSIANFLTRYQIELDKNSLIPDKFKDIPHGKPDQRPWNNGLSASIATLEIPIFENNDSTPVRTGAMLHKIGLELEREGTALLAEKRRQANPSRPGKGPSTPHPSDGGNSQ